MEEELKYYTTSNIRCPYCNADIKIDHEDGHGYEEGETHKQECPVCDKVFKFYTHVSFSYEVGKCDCQNEGGEHVWKPTNTYPKKYTQMECEICGERRRPTEEEKLRFKLFDKNE